MCIIAYKPEGVATPAKDILKTCFENNPHGAGLFILRPGEKVAEIHKGYMSFADFWDFASVAVSPEDMAAYHFRITTSGGTCPENCHPFPVSSDVADLRALSIRSRYVFVHNGIIGAGSPELSDTQLYVRDTLTSLVGKLKNKATQDRIAADTIGSRTLTVDARYHEAILTGNWIEDKDTGLLFSNSSYLARGYGFGLRSHDYPHEADDAGMLADMDVCPDCGGSALLVSEYHGLYECESCHCLFDCYGNVWADGEF